MKWKSLRSWEQQDPGVYIVDGDGRVIYADSDSPEVNLSPTHADYIVDAINEVTELRAEVERLRGLVHGKTDK